MTKVHTPGLFGRRCQEASPARGLQVTPAQNFDMELVSASDWGKTPLVSCGEERQTSDRWQMSEVDETNVAGLSRALSAQPHSALVLCCARAAADNDDDNDNFIVNVTLRTARQAKCKNKMAKRTWPGQV
jgi:hypothetical protein